jgi:hypothetical protein
MDVRERTPGPASRTPRRRARAAVFCAYLALQLAVPLVGLSAARPARFGWQMYSWPAEVGRYLVVDARGEKSRVELDEYLPRLRPEIRYEEQLPPHLCQVIDGAVAVEIVLADSTDGPGRYRCP